MKYFSLVESAPSNLRLKLPDKKMKYFFKKVKSQEEMTLIL